MVVLFCDRVSVELFKEVFQRYRPSRNLEIGDLLHLHIDDNGNPYTGGWYGFVSSHATNFFGMAMYFWLWLRPAKRWVVLMLFSWAAFVSYTRIYLGVHYPFDMLGAAAVSALCAWLCSGRVAHTLSEPLHRLGLALHGVVLAPCVRRGWVRK